MSFDRYNRRLPVHTDWADWYVRSIKAFKVMRIVHAVVREEYGGTLIAACGRKYPADGSNEAFTNLASTFGQGFPWRECSRCAKRVGHYDWQVR